MNWRREERHFETNRVNQRPPCQVMVALEPIRGPGQAENCRRTIRLRSPRTKVARLARYRSVLCREARAGL